jgi:PPOX class probable F420-dependent enzyme
MTPEPSRIRGHIPWERADLLLRVTRSVILSTTRPNGRPHGMPVWFVWERPFVYFATGRSTQKARNLAGQSWVVAHFGNGDDVLMAEGPAEIVTNPDEQQRADAAYRAKYVDPRKGKQASVFDNPEDDLYRITVTRVITWMYGNAGGWTEWRLGEEAAVESSDHD